MTNQWRQNGFAYPYDLVIEVLNRLPVFFKRFVELLVNAIVVEVDGLRRFGETLDVQGGALSVKRWDYLWILVRLTTKDHASRRPKRAAEGAVCIRCRLRHHAALRRSNNYWTVPCNAQTLTALAA